MKEKDFPESLTASWGISKTAMSGKLTHLGMTPSTLKSFIQPKRAAGPGIRIWRPCSRGRSIGIWALQQYDQMVQYTTAMKLGTADTEDILRRFTRDNAQHPTYRALAALGEACKTAFLCRYLRLTGRAIC